MPGVTAKQNENSESLIRRFKRACEKDAVLNEIKRRNRHIPRADLRKQERDASIKRHKKRLSKEEPIPSRGIRGKKRRKKTDRA